MKHCSIPFASKAFFAYEYFKHSKKNILVVFSDEEAAFKASVQLRFLFKETDHLENIIFFPSFDTIPYDRLSPSAHVLLERANILTNLSFDNLYGQQARLYRDHANNLGHGQSASSIDNLKSNDSLLREAPSERDSGDQFGMMKVSNSFIGINDSHGRAVNTAFYSKKIIVTSAQNLITKLPPQGYFIDNTLYLSAPLKVKELNCSVDISYDESKNRPIGHEIDGSAISMEEVIAFLIRAGFNRGASAIESGEFAVRGEILDIVTENTRDRIIDNNVSDKYDYAGYISRGAYRINFGFDGIESIREFDVNTQISTRQVSSIRISPASEAMLTDKTILNFKHNFLKLFGVNNSKSPLYEKVVSGSKFQAYEHLAPLLFDHMVSIFDYIRSDISDVCLIADDLSMASIKEAQGMFEDFYQARLQSNKNNSESSYYAVPPANLILNEQELNILLKSMEVISIRGGIGEVDNVPTVHLLREDEVSEPGRDDQVSQEDLGSRNIGKKSNIVTGEFGSYTQIPKLYHTAAKNGQTAFDELFDLIVLHKQKIPLIFCTSQSGVERIKTGALERGYACHEVESLIDVKKNFVNLAIAPLSSGFITNQYLFISEQDIWGDKFSTASYKSNKKKLKNLLDEIDNIEEGQFVVHTEHGVGRFDKVETILVQDRPHDCLKIIYADNDILYLPVENIEVIKKFGGDEAVLDKLGGVSWQKRKAKVKGHIKEIANQLMQITAKRLLQNSRPNVYDKDAYDKFCSKFPYSETDDQMSAIADIMKDLSSGKLMDRLVCGDVGFGKTEVAMRAAFMCAFDTGCDRPQIVVIAPTTILCRQHYENFKERFRGFGLEIVQLSRLVSSAALRRHKESIKHGKADIIIGTHALLSKGIEFSNLKMVIIDEEQHFGVSQKERLKELKLGVHVISLSATPIPRTLQMSMLGIKDLSLIATAPIDRLPIRTSVLPFDPLVVRDALIRERFRGGRSFFVCPRIKDIEDIEKQLSHMVPELTYRIAHGQMSPGAIDDVMSDFSEGKFDILLSTTIIESGIDIPAANTIIISRADMLGLSQLYQLRGRVGRGKVRGYAYLTLTPRRKMTKHSLKRLEVLQNIDSLGAGFTIASHDMDIRGFGNLVGDQQSGHIREVGAELYQDMLESAMRDLQLEARTKCYQAANDLEMDEKSQRCGEDEHLGYDPISQYTPTINLGLSVYIPEFYIQDSSLRLAIYRRVGGFKSNDEVARFKDEMIDRFGLLPPEFVNLLAVMELKIICYRMRIESLDSGPGGFVVKFREDFDNSDMVMEFIKLHPRQSRMKENCKLVYMTEVKPDNCLEKARELLAAFENI